MGDAEDGPEDDGAHGAFEDDAEAGAHEQGPDDAPRAGRSEGARNGLPGVGCGERDDREEEKQAGGAHAGEDREQEVVGAADVEFFAVFRIVFADEALGDVVAEAEAEVGVAVEGFVDDGLPPDEPVEVVVALVERLGAAVGALAGRIEDRHDAFVEAEDRGFFPGNAPRACDAEDQNDGDDSADELGDGETPATANGEPGRGDDEGEHGRPVVRGDDAADEDEADGSVPESAAGFEAEPEKEGADGDKRAGEIAFEVDDRVAAEREDVEEEVREAFEEQERGQDERAAPSEDIEKHARAARVAGEILTEIEKCGVVNQREVPQRHETERADVEDDAKCSEDDPRQNGEAERIAAQGKFVAPGGLNEEDSAGEEEREFRGKERKLGAKGELGEAAVTEDVAGADRDDDDVAERERLGAGEEEKGEQAGDGGRPKETAMSDVDGEPHGDDRGARGEKSGAPDRCDRHANGESCEFREDVGNR